MSYKTTLKGCVYLIFALTLTQLAFMAGLPQNAMEKYRQLESEAMLEEKIAKSENIDIKEIIELSTKANYEIVLDEEKVVVNTEEIDKYDIVDIDTENNKLVLRER